MHSNGPNSLIFHFPNFIFLPSLSDYSVLLIRPFISLPPSPIHTHENVLWLLRSYLRNWFRVELPRFFWKQLRLIWHRGSPVYLTWPVLVHWSTWPVIPLSPGPLPAVTFAISWCCGDMLMVCYTTAHRDNACLNKFGGQRTKFPHLTKLINFCVCRTNCSHTSDFSTSKSCLKPGSLYKPLEQPCFKTWGHIWQLFQSHSNPIYSEVMNGQKEGLCVRNTSFVYGTHCHKSW